MNCACGVLILLFICYCHCSPCNNFTGAGEPLFLSPLINSDQIETAKQLSQVEPFDGFNYTSHSGFITIDQNYSSNIFFWFFLSKNDSANAPVILFFNGGPGTSAMFGLFGEVGPFSVEPNLELVKREFTWVDQHNVIFADIPIGAGYSFTENSRGFATNDDEFATQVVLFLEQFFKLFPEFLANEFYLSAESYSGKPVPAIGALIHNLTVEQSLPVPINLRGLIVISGFIKPLEELDSTGDHLYHCGLLNQKQREYFINTTNQIHLDLEQGLITQASIAAATLIMLASNETFTYFTKFTGMTDFSDLRETNLPPVFSDFTNFVKCDAVRNRIHVGNSTFSSGIETTVALINDVLFPATENYEYLLNEDYRILFLNGNMDLVMNPFAQRNIISGLQWKATDVYNDADRIIWKVNENDDVVAGYVTVASNLIEVMVRNAGHMVPYNQPRAVLDALTRFLSNQTFY